MKIEKIIKLEEHEIDALRTLANIDCSAISCYDCKFKLKTGNDNKCLLVAIRSFLVSQEIMDLETWIIRLLDEIEGAANRNENYDLHLESQAVAEIAKAYEDTKWIEIY